MNYSLWCLDQAVVQIWHAFAKLTVMLPTYERSVPPLELQCSKNETNHKFPHCQYVIMHITRHFRPRLVMPTMYNLVPSRLSLANLSFVDVC